MRDGKVIVVSKEELANKRANELDKTLTRKINQSAEIEQILLDMAAGKLPLPSQQDCRVLALRLGTPKKEWSAAVAEHQWEGQND